MVGRRSESSAWGATISYIQSYSDSRALSFRHIDPLGCIPKSVGLNKDVMVTGPRCKRVVSIGCWCRGLCRRRNSFTRGPGTPCPAASRTFITREDCPAACSATASAVRILSSTAIETAPCPFRRNRNRRFSRWGMLTARIYPAPQSIRPAPPTELHQPHRERSNTRRRESP